MFLVLDIARIFINIGWGVLIILVFFILYRLLIKRLERKKIPQQKFAELANLKDDKVGGEVQFFFKLQEEKPIKFTIYSKNERYKEIISEKLYPKGGHILNYNTQKLEDGHYFYELKTDNQKITKLFEVKN